MSECGWSCGWAPRHVLTGILTPATAAAPALRFCMACPLHLVPQLLGLAAVVTGMVMNPESLLWTLEATRVAGAKRQLGLGQPIWAPGDLSYDMSS